ncbi:MAG: L,D-transpeptidase family protein [Pseudomonadota bacterium]
MYSRRGFMAFGALLGSAVTLPAHAQSAEAIAAYLKGADKGITAYYKANGFKPIWTGNKNRSRRTALLNALKTADDHGLPLGRYKIDTLAKAFKGRDNKSMGQAEVLASQVFVTYARDLNSGLLRPSRVDSEIAMNPGKASAESLLAGVSKGNAKSYLAGLAPSHPDYKQLVNLKKSLARKSDKSGQALPNKTLKPGVASNSVVILRQKLAAQGYRNLGQSKTYDAKLVATVKDFQKKRGLSADGIVGTATIDALNLGNGAKMRHVLANLERQRWMNFERGKRHIFVNLPDFSVQIVDNGKQSFYSRTVIGKRGRDFRSPEFVDKMTHMVINPTWHVPSSIAQKEYLPIIKNDPGYLARKGMRMINQAGQTVNPASINLAAYGENNFPYSIKQRPNPGNALGKVKFMFPNRFNIYLHDTPAKSLFGKETRAFSHGCIRVHKPFEFAYALLSRQSGNPKGLFHGYLDTGAEKYVNLKAHVPVIIAYQTVIFDKKGGATFKGDIYGRDAKIIRALQKAGVAV